DFESSGGATQSHRAAVPGQESQTWLSVELAERNPRHAHKKGLAMIKHSVEEHLQSITGRSHFQFLIEGAYENGPPKRLNGSSGLTMLFQPLKHRNSIQMLELSLLAQHG